MRRAIARRMRDSKREAPHFYVSSTVEMDSALAALDSLNADRESGERISVTAFLVHACARALERHEQLNAVWTPDGLAVVEQVNVSVAVAIDGGVIAPSLTGCQRLSLTDTATALNDLVARAQTDRLRGSELTEGTFTLSNLGMFPVSQFTAIVTPPQVAVLATGAITRVPALAVGGVIAKSVMAATVSADHRAVDGVDVARFLESLKEIVEEQAIE
jgi:pyruvate dehydrogenase E2 component (dihydrolipoamide acetyltransferase)